MTSQRLRPGLPLGPGSLRLQAILQDAKDTAVSTALPLVDKLATPTRNTSTSGSLKSQWATLVAIHSVDDTRVPFPLTGTRSAVSGDWPVVSTASPGWRRSARVSAVTVCTSDPAPSWCRPAPTRSADVKLRVRLTAAYGSPGVRLVRSNGLDWPGFPRWVAWCPTLSGTSEVGGSFRAAGSGDYTFDAALRIGSSGGTWT